MSVLPSERALLFEIADRLDRIERRLTSNPNVIELWQTKKQLAAELGISVRWLELRMAEGLPRREIAGRIRFQRPVVETWLRRRGFLKEIS